MVSHGYARATYEFIQEFGKVTPGELSKVEGFQKRNTSGILRKMLFYGILDRKVGNVYCLRWPSLSYDEAMKNAECTMEAA